MSSCTFTINDGVWYSFTGTGGDVTINQSSAWDAEIAVYSACPPVSCIAGADDDTTFETVTFLTTLGVTYYLNIGYFFG
ncbi:MAG: hypothetical protein IPL08_13935 [Saprospiraceae bacterium]|nr:hypothetical protein [Saprospiraceae bacterium]